MNDAGKHAERNATDGLLGRERERARADSLMDTTRREADAASLDTDALEDADRARRWSVLPMVTHDLRSPLGMIALNAQMIAEDSNESSIRDAARDISRSSSHMGRLLMDLLDVARFESGTFSVRPLQHDVGEFLSALLRSHVRLFAQREITFLVEAPTEIVKARFDRDRLTQVLTNLLGNAMKFTPRHGTVVLSVVKQADGVEFAVCDSGPGIAAVAMATLFERFSQVDNDSRRGLGLGLHICKQIVTAHHGRIWVDADQTKGATFRFTLPD